MNKILVFDMDGTIADLYGVDNWLSDLRTFSPRPYVSAKPLYDMNTLNSLLKAFKEKGWRIVVTSWLSKESTKEYDDAVRQAKLDWLNQYDFPFDEIHLVKYGTTKANCTRKLNGLQILIDDNEKIRKGWNNNINRFSIDANQNIIDELLKLLLATN